MITRSISDSRDLRAAISDAGQYDAIVLWLNREEILALNGEPAFGKLTVFSGILGGAENLPVSSAWRAQARMVFPYELPSRRGANLAYFRSWLNSRGIELIDESMQSEVYFAASYLRDTLGEMLNNFHRDYLLERADSQLSLWQSRKAIDESLQRQNLRQRFVHYIESTSSPASSNDDAVNNPTTASSAARQARVTAADNLAARTGSTVYPSLSLGPGQRFASKGAYIVRFVGESDATIHLEADGPWRIP